MTWTAAADELVNLVTTERTLAALTDARVRFVADLFPLADHLTLATADEYGPVGVRFNTVRPGFIATEIMEGIPRESPVYDSYIENTPLGDVGQPEDVAHLVRFLVSEESRWITGQEIGVDGGHTLRRGPDFTAFIEPAIGAKALRAQA
jgi:hypothetical protein